MRENCYELRWRVGQEKIKTGFMNFFGEKEKVLPEAREVAQRIHGRNPLMKDFSLRGPWGEETPISVS